MSQLAKVIRSRSRVHQQMYANDFSVLNPTIWANEAIVRLTPNMVVSNVVARDWDSKVAKFGDIVNAYVPGTFAMTRKGALCEDVQIQDASGTSIQVALNQWPQVSFLICDGEEDRSQFDLIENNLVPAVQALSEGIDRIVGAQVYQFLSNTAGHLGEIDDSNFQEYVLEAREVMNMNNVPLAGRVMLLTPSTETAGLMVDNLMTADKIGDGGTALEQALLGRKYGFTFVMTQTQPQISTGQTVITGAINLAAGYPVGQTAITVDAAVGGSYVVGQWMEIDGDDSPQQIVTVTSGTALVISPGLKRSVADNAVLTIVKPGAVNLTAGYAAGYVGEILTDGWTSAPQIGQMVTFGITTTKYAIIKLRVISGTEYGIELDKPLAAAIANDATVNLGPAGKYNFGLLRNGLVLVNRPPPTPRVGALARVINDPVNKISIRVVISYDAVKQGHLVTLDTFVGVGVLDEDLGVVMLG